MSNVRRTVGAPHDRLTRISDVAIKAVEAAPEYEEGDKVIIFLDDGDKGGFVLSGYDDDVDAIADLFIHLKALMRANGKEMLLVPLRQG